MNTEVENHQAGKDGPHVPIEMLTALRDAVRNGDADLVERRRAEVVTAAKAAVKRAAAIKDAREEATALENLMANPQDADAETRVAQISLAPTAAEEEFRVTQGSTEIAPTLFRIHGRGGSALSIGSVAMLSGEGGAGKSTLVREIALSVLNHGYGGNGMGDPPTDPLVVCRGGPVLWLNYEEDPGLLNHRILERAKDRRMPEAVIERLFIRNMAGDEHVQWPLFGPADQEGRSGFYNATPERLAGWDMLLETLERIRRREGTYPELIVLDPVLSAYTGDSNNVSPVRAVTGALTGLAKSRDCGILVLAHATKEGNLGPFDRRQVGGSGAWTDAVRCAMTLTKGDGTGVPGSTARSFAMLKANAGPDDLWTRVTPVRPNGAARGPFIGFERQGETSWFERELWLSDADERKKQRKERRRTSTPNGGGLRANGGATNGAEARKNGDDAPQSGVGNGSGDSTLAV